MQVLKASVGEKHMFTLVLEATWVKGIADANVESWVKGIADANVG